MKDKMLTRMKEALTAANRIAVISHVRPDGDAIGSVLGMGLSLQEAGKDVQMVLQDGIPHSFAFLTGANQVKNSVRGDVDYLIVLDCGDLGRVGGALSDYGQPDLNIDHHVTNTYFAHDNLVDTDAVSTTAILTQLLPALGFGINQAVANALLTGLITDTLGFRTSNITAAALRLAADLMEAGGNLPELYLKTLVEKSFEAARFWGAGLSVLQRENGIIWTSLTMASRRAAGYSGRDDADLINLLSSVEGANVFVIFVEQPNGNVKISWRSRDGYDVSNTATFFGGGGHPNAAGAEIEGDLEEVQEHVLKVTKKLFTEAVNLPRKTTNA